MIILGRRFFNWVLVAACSLYAACLAASLYNLAVLFMIFSIAGSGLAATVLFVCYFAYSPENSGRIAVMLYMLGCAFWLAGDVAWLVIHLTGGYPAESGICKALYLYTNLFIFAGSMLFLFQQFKKWSLLQLLLDTVAVFFLGFITIWFTILHSADDWLRYITMDGLSSVASMLADFLLLVGVFIWFFSRRQKKNKISIFNVGALWLLAFGIVDLYYYGVYYQGAYIPNSFIDSVYVAVLLGLAMSVLCNVTAHRIDEERTPFTKGGTGIRWYILLVFPAVTLLMKGFSLNEMLMYMLVIVLYLTASRQVNFSMRSVDLLRREKELNNMLEQKLSEQLTELTVLANQDTVTSLYNRRYFLSTLEQTLQELEQCEAAALILIDLDRFKNINDNFGHDVGDNVLIEISKRLVQWDRFGSVVARLGGDEFAILTWSSTRKREDLEVACRQIVEVCSKPICLDGRTLYVTISIGVAVYPLDAQDAISLLKNADISMYRAKDMGYNQVVFYDSLFNDTLAKKHKIELLLRQANMDTDFKLYYQPQFSIPERKLLGAEALIRWEAPGEGFIPPTEFIPVAEEIDYIHKIGIWMKGNAIRQITEWNRQHSLDLRVGINLSPKELVREDFAASFKNVIAKHHANPAWIDAEITENVMLDSEKVMHVFELFNNLGVTVSIDDFGSGYSSWGYLTRFPFDRIKIDRALVENLSYGNANSIQVVKAIISMAKAVGKKTIAEGVEKYEQLDILTSLHCDQVQGYLLGRPVPADVFENQFIRKDTQTAMFPQDTRR